MFSSGDIFHLDDDDDLNPEAFGLELFVWWP